MIGDALKKVLVTGSSGLVGSACVRHFARLGCEVLGVDNNQRRDFFGPDGDTIPTLQRLQAEVSNFTHYKTDIRDRAAVLAMLRKKPDLILHCAAQPSHDLAAMRPFDDFDVNANGTLNLLEGTRQYCPDAAFCFASTNKVYGDEPNRLALVELETRWEYSDLHRLGINEATSIDQCLHSLFGASKLAADVACQEYGRTFGLRTGIFRFGCLTGAAHAAAEQHGFLAYLARCLKEGRTYRVFGYGGKQVRDNLHAADVAAAFEAFANDPEPAAVYNLGGGRENSTSILEAIAAMEELAGKKLDVEHVAEPRRGDHVCYYTDNTRFRDRYPAWEITRDLDSIYRELLGVAA